MGGEITGSLGDANEDDCLPDITPCNAVVSDRRFGDDCRLHHQGDE